MADIEMIPIVSSNIESYGYDPENKLLKIKFVNSESVYCYDDVQEATAEGFRHSGSPGQYFRVNIKGVYRFYKE